MNKNKKNELNVNYVLTHLFAWSYKADNATFREVFGSTGDHLWDKYLNSGHDIGMLWSSLDIDNRILLSKAIAKEMS